MTRIQQAHDAVLGSVVHVELMRADRVGLDADSEDLAFDRICDILAVVLDGKNLIKCFLEAGTRSDAVCRHILRAIRDPDVVECRDAELLAEVIGNLAASLAMSNPEIADILVRARERHVVLDVLVAEERRVEVETDALFLREIDPGLEVFRLDLVAVYLLIRDAVRSVQIELVLARDQGVGFVYVGHEFLRIASAARVVARRRNPARQRIGIKAKDIIALPAVHRDAHLL